LLKNWRISQKDKKEIKTSIELAYKRICPSIFIAPNPYCTSPRARTTACTLTPLARPQPERDFERHLYPQLVSLHNAASGAGEAER
jgi:hypothetical protein